MSRKEKFIDKEYKMRYIKHMRTYEEYIKYIQRLLLNINLDENNPEDERMVVLSSKQIETLAKLLSQKKRDKKSEIAFIAGFIKAHGEIEDGYGDVKEKSRVRGILKKYKHGINLNRIKGDIQSVFDRKNTMFLNWHNSEAKGMDCAAIELEQSGIFFESENPADQFVAMQEMWEKSKPIYVKDHCDSQKLKEGIIEWDKRQKDE